MTVLVTGARGRVAGALLALLHSAGIPARATSKNPDLLSPPGGLPAVRCDLADPSTFDAALGQVDSVFLYAEATHIDAFIQRARAVGVKHVVLLSSSAVLAPDAAEHPIAGPHLAVERALEAAAARGDFEATLLRPGVFATNALQWAGPLRDGRPVELPYPHSYGDPIHELDIAESALAVLTEPRQRGTAHLLTGPESLDFTEQLAVIAEVTGRPAPYTAVTPAHWKASTSGYLPDALAGSLLAYWASHDAIPTPLSRTVEKLTGHPARTFAAWVADHANAFRD
ncbi:NAD(P)H-binding protein [Streptomyces sp. NPDC056632]|uniref:NmrA family NAD(P)-binding protein n=1 Tax=Streptomyces sp. NPDC056632 TaxID=3345884 RepID=UPI00368C37E9